MIVALASGPLQELGLAEQHVVLGIGGREVGDATAFAKLAGDEYGGLAGRGGMLRLKVAADGGAPRELAAAIKAPRPELAPAPANAKRPRDPAPAGGNVNVWDKLGAARAAAATINAISSGGFRIADSLHGSRS